MWSGDVEVFAFMVDLADATWVGVDSSFAVADDCVLAPGGFPEFVGYFDVFFSDGIAVVVLVICKFGSGAVQVSGQHTCGCSA